MMDFIELSHTKGRKCCDETLDQSHATGPDLHTHEEKQASKQCKISSFEILSGQPLALGVGPLLQML